MDPIQSDDGSDAYGHLVHEVSWLIQPRGVLKGEHLESLADDPPVQGEASFDTPNVGRGVHREGSAVDDSCPARDPGSVSRKQATPVDRVSLRPDDRGCPDPAHPGVSARTARVRRGT